MSIDHVIKVVTIGTIVGPVALPANASQETGGNLDAISLSVASIDGAVATEATLALLNGKVSVCDTGNVAGTVTANQGGVWDIVSNAQNIATETTLVANAASVASIDGKITACNTGAVVISSSALPANAAQETGGNLAANAASVASIDGKVTTVNTSDTRQGTHDNLNLNANLQVGDADVDSTNPVPTTQATGSVDDVHPVDTNGLDMDVQEDAALPANTRGLIFAGEDLGGVVRFPTVTVDPVDTKRRQEIQGKVTISAQEPPPASTPVQYTGDTPLNVTSDETDDYLIANGVTLTVTSVVAGAEGDPNERGSKVEVSFVAATVEHLLTRIYLSGFSTQFFPDTDTTRDGTTMTGNGTDTYLRIYRERMGGSGAEIDCVVRGFTQ